MKIACMDFFQKGNNAEEEITKRLKYCFEKQGDRFFIIDKHGFFIDSSEYNGKHIEETDVDVFFAFNHSEKTPILPNKYGVFFHWAPSGFLPPWLVKNYISNLLCFDNIFGGYGTKDAYYDCINAGMKNASLVHIGSSVPADFVLPPKRIEKKKLFYCGINLEAKTTNQRFGNLFKYLDKEDKINFYGPKSVFGIKDCWAGYNNYKGEIPFDGKSIIEKINETGIVLALNSPVHSAVGSVSNRIYEAAAGGAVIISDDNPYVRKYFNDNVFYVNLLKSEEELSKEILNIVNFINEHPEKSYEMAVNAQESFKQNLTLDNMIKNAKEHFFINISPNDDLIDVICFVETNEGFSKLRNMLNNQTHKNLNIIFICPNSLSNKIDSKECCTFLNNLKTKGAIFLDIKDNLKGKYFIFLDEFSEIQNRYIEKMISHIKDVKCNFVYSGSYLRKKNSYNYSVINDIAISQNDFLSFFQNDIFTFFSVEQKVPKQCCIFSNKLLNDLDGIAQINEAVHLYFIATSLLKYKDLGCFCPIIQSGYALDETNSISDTCNQHMFIQYCRTHGTAFKELCGVFLKFDNTVLAHKDSSGKNHGAAIHKKTNMIIHHINTTLFKFIKTIKKNMPELTQEIELDTYLRKRKILRNILFFISKINDKKGG